MVENLIGKTFNLLEVIDGPIRKNNKIYWRCKCECGAEKEIRADGLKNGTTKSCGCFKKKILIQGNIERQTVDLQNIRFGKLIAKEKTDKRNNDGRVIWNCLCDCGNWIEVDSHSLQQKKIQSCGCLKSKGEFIISSLLKAYAIPFTTQQTFENCRFSDSGYYARFDFYINNQYLLEYDGEQHFYYKSNPNTWNTEQNYLKTIAHDEYKNQWCKENNIPLIRIPYTELEDLSIEDILLETTKFRVI